MNAHWLDCRHPIRRGGWSLVLFAACVGCRPAIDEPSITIVVSGDTAGWITPCGCAANQSGGLSRRATLLSGFGRPGGVLYLDAGGSASGTTEYQQIKLEAILRGLQAMNLAAHNIGAAESALEPDQLAALAERTGVHWLSANLQTAAGAPSPAKRHLVVKRDGVRFAVTGVVDPALVENTAWTAREPVSAVLEALRDVTADVYVVLAYYDEAGLRSLAQSLPEVDFVIGGPTGQTMRPAQVGPVAVTSATNKGKFLAHVQLTRAAGGSHQTEKIASLEVSSDLAEDRVQVDNLMRYYSVLAERDFTVEEAGLVSHRHPGGENYRIAGSEACAKCHVEDHTTWRASQHSHAWNVLVAKQAHVDPYCQQCHTTGYGSEGGFVSISRSPHLVHVGCENCHGPSSAHVADPRVKTPFLAREMCIRCHDYENSPQFAYDTHWPKIHHGQPATAKWAAHADTPAEELADP